MRVRIAASDSALESSEVLPSHGAAQVSQSSNCA